MAPARRCVDLDGDGALTCDDCDDDDASVFPGAEELMNGIDDDCDDEIDEDLVTELSTEAVLDLYRGEPPAHGELSCVSCPSDLAVSLVASFPTDEPYGLEVESMDFDDDVLTLEISSADDAPLGLYDLRWSKDEQEGDLVEVVRLNRGELVLLGLSGLPVIMAWQDVQTLIVDGLNLDTAQAPIVEIYSLLADETLVCDVVEFTATQLTCMLDTSLARWQAGEAELRVRDGDVDEVDCAARYQDCATVQVVW